MPAIPPSTPDFPLIPPVGPRPPGDTHGRLSELQQAINEGRAFAKAPRRTATGVTDAALNRHEKRAEKMRDPEWTAEEVNQMSELYAVLSRHHLNPSFWGYVHGLGIDEEVYAGLEAAIANPHLLHYREAGQNTLEIIPRREESSELQGLIRIVLRYTEKKDGVKDYRITEIKKGGKKMALAPKAWLDWPDYIRIVRHRADIGTAISSEDMTVDLPPESPDWIQIQTEYEHQGPRLLLRLLAARKRGYFSSAEKPNEDPKADPQLQKMVDALSRHGENYETNYSPQLGQLVYVYPEGFNEGVIEVTSTFGATTIPEPWVAYTPEGVIMDSVGQISPIDKTPSGAVDAFFLYGVDTPELQQAYNELLDFRRDINQNVTDYNTAATNPAWKLTVNMDNPKVLNGELDGRLESVTDLALHGRLTSIKEALTQFLADNAQFLKNAEASRKDVVKRRIMERYQPLIGH